MSNIYYLIDDLHPKNLALRADVKRRNSPIHQKLFAYLQIAKLRKLGYGWLTLATYNQKYDLQSFPALVTISCKEFKDTD